MVTATFDNWIKRTGAKLGSNPLALDQFKSAVRAGMGCEADVFLFWKGRVALYAILKALGVREGDEVILPGFTCVVVPNAVRYLNAVPVYADVDPGTFTVTRDTIRPLITRKTRVIITQNTFGLSSDLEPILTLASDHGIEVVDDCAHGFGGRYKGRLNGTLTRTAFFSSQWNKPFSTGLGGFMVTTDRQLAERMEELEKVAVQPDARDVLLLAMMYRVRYRLVNGNNYWKFVKLYRWLSERGVVVGSSEGGEVEGVEMPDRYLKGMSSVQAAAGVDALKDYDQSRSFRRELADSYDRLLLELGKSPPVRPEYAEHLFLRYPIFVKRKDVFLRLAQKHNVRLGDWFRSPLHPVEGDLSRWKYRWGCCPNSERISRHIVNLPTEAEMGVREVERVKNFVVEHSEGLL